LESKQKLTVNSQARDHRVTIAGFGVAGGAPLERVRQLQRYRFRRSRRGNFSGLLSKSAARKRQSWGDQTTILE